MDQTKEQILEINLISAQGLKPPSKNSTRKMQTYALAWVDSSTKLRTQIDRIGGENPTWNDKFLFRVTPEFLASETSAICVEIYAISYVRDPLLGTVRFLISNILPSPSSTTVSSSPSSQSSPSAGATMIPFFTALQIRRPSGRFNGILNVGAMVVNNPEFASAMSDVSAMGYRGLMGHNSGRRGDGIRKVKSMDFHSFLDENASVTDGESGNISDGSESTNSSSSTASASTALKSWNGLRDLNSHVRSASDGGGMLSCFIKQWRPRLRPSPSDQNLKAASLGPEENNN